MELVTVVGEVSAEDAWSGWGMLGGMGDGGERNWRVRSVSQKLLIWVRTDSTCYNFPSHEEYYVNVPIPNQSRNDAYRQFNNLMQFNVHNFQA